MYFYEVVALQGKFRMFKTSIENKPASPLVKLNNISTMEIH